MTPRTLIHHHPHGAEPLRGSGLSSSRLRSLRSLRSLLFTAPVFLILLSIAPGAHAQQPVGTNILTGARIDQKLDAQIPLDLPFRDEDGRDVRLQDYFGKRPVVLVMAYYECPMLCTMVLNGLVKALNVVNLRMGEDYDVITVSFDPGETPALATAKKKAYMAEYRHPGAAKGWHFLTGDAEPIRQLTEAVGFHYVYDPAIDQYAHASGIMVATPDGRLSKYFYGIEYSGRDLRLGLVDASQRRIGSMVDVVLLWCYHYDPVTGRYGWAIMRALRAAGALTVLALAGFGTRALYRERRAARSGAHA
jgi:protein SCO1/2